MRNLLNFDAVKTRGKESRNGKRLNSASKNRREQLGVNERRSRTVPFCRRPRRGLARHPSNSGWLSRKNRDGDSGEMAEKITTVQQAIDS